MICYSAFLQHAKTLQLIYVPSPLKFRLIIYTKNTLDNQNTVWKDSKVSSQRVDRKHDVKRLRQIHKMRFKIAYHLCKWSELVKISLKLPRKGLSLFLKYLL